MRALKIDQSRANPLYTPDFLTRRIDTFYRERVEKTWKGGHIVRGKRPKQGDILLMSNDYLGLSHDPQIIRQQCGAMERGGNGLFMSAIFLNGPNPQYRLEEKFARFLHAEATILTQSGWCANTGLIQSIADETTPVYIDMFTHMSLWDGIRAAGAIPMRFRHNDVGHLATLIRQNGPGIIAVDSVYSTSGSVAPLRDLVDVAKQYGCVTVVDESHSLGTHGPAGAGLVVALGLAEDVHFRTASLAKAFCGRAGIITCTESFYDYFITTSRPAVFSSALLPQDMAGLSASIDVIRHAHDRRRRLHANAEKLRRGLDELGYNVDDSESQIIPLESGPEPNTLILRDALEKNCVFGAVFADPATPKNRSLVRLSVHSELGEEELTRLLEVCAKIRKQVHMEDWPSTKRKQRKKTRLLA